MFLISNSIFCFSCIHHVERLISSLLLKETVVLHGIFPLSQINYNMKTWWIYIKIILS